MGDWVKVAGVVMQGHGVASGRASDPRYPAGTIEMQKPFFAEQGVNLDPYFSGTINVSIHPYQYRVKKPKYTLKDVKWTPDGVTEDFSFFDCKLILANDKNLNGLIYYPHPETKPEHFQSPDVLEIITSYVDDLNYGDQVILAVNSVQLDIC